MHNGGLKGGTHSNGFVWVKDFSVGPGKIAEVRASMAVECGALRQTLVTAAGVTWDGTQQRYVRVELPSKGGRLLLNAGPSRP